MRHWKKFAVALALAALWPVLACAGQVVTATVSFGATFNESIATGLPSPLYSSQTVSQIDNYATGTGSGQVNLAYAAQISLVASTPQTIDLTTLTDPLGKAVAFARVRDFVVQNISTAAGADCKVYPAVSNGWAILPGTSSVPNWCRYGAIFRVSDRLSTGSGIGNVAGASSKVVTFDPGANAVTINVWILGCDAQ